MPDEARNLRVMSYNVYGCVDISRKVDVDQVAAIIADSHADVVALQEVDADKPFGENRNQARRIGESLGFDYRYLPIEKAGRHVYGLGVLSRYPIESSDSTALPNLHPRLHLRKRGAMRAALHTPGGRVHLINTHLSVFRIERYFQLKALVRRFDLPSLAAAAPTIFCGDLNANSSSAIYRSLSRHLTDVQTTGNHDRVPEPTFPATVPVFRIDHIFVSHHCRVRYVDVIRNGRTATASDHLPLIADLQVSLPHAQGR